MMQSIVHFLRELEYKLQNHVVPLFMILDNEYLMDWEIKTKQLWAAHSHNEDHYDAKSNWNHIYTFYCTYLRVKKMLCAWWFELLNLIFLSGLCRKLCLML